VRSCERSSCKADVIREIRCRAVEHRLESVYCDSYEEMI